MSTPTICNCGYQIPARPELAGKKVKCPKCGIVLHIPAIDDDDFSLAPAEPRAAPTSIPVEAPPANPCPACGLDRPEKVRMCANCGFDERTGQKSRGASEQTLAQKFKQTPTVPGWLPAWAAPAWNDDIPHSGFDMIIRGVIGLGGLLAVISVFRAWTPGSNGLAIGWAGYATLVCGALTLCGVALVAHRGVYSLLVAFSFLASLLGLAAVLIYLPFASTGWGKLDSHFGTLARITGTSLDFLLLGPPLALIGFALAFLASCVYLYANVVAAE